MTLSSAQQPIASLTLLPCLCSSSPPLLLPTAPSYFFVCICLSLHVPIFSFTCHQQLAMKFLEKDELSNYTFQNDFMRPFVVVMRQSQVGGCARH